MVRAPSEARTGVVMAFGCGRINHHVGFARCCGKYIPHSLGSLTTTMGTCILTCRSSESNASGPVYDMVVMPHVIAFGPLRLVQVVLEVGLVRWGTLWVDSPRSYDIPKLLHNTQPWPWNTFDDLEQFQRLQKAQIDGRLRTLTLTLGKMVIGQSVDSPQKDTKGKQTKQDIVDEIGHPAGDSQPSQESFGFIHKWGKLLALASRHAIFVNDGRGNRSSNKVCFDELIDQGQDNFWTVLGINVKYFVESVGNP
ncbi:hypothetical protein LXL04_011199 [Taraxacum kok-saghyz]